MAAKKAKYIDDIHWLTETTCNMLKEAGSKIRGWQTRSDGKIDLLDENKKVIQTTGAENLYWMIKLLKNEMKA